MNVRTVVALLVPVLLPALARAESTPVRAVFTGELRARMALAPPAESGFSLVDVRTRVEFAEEHIDGAVHAPCQRIRELLPSLSPDRRREVVLYGNGPRCHKSAAAARAARAAGWRRVRVYEEGMPAWRRAGLATRGTALPPFAARAIAPSELEALLAEPGAPVVVDVRDAAEYAHGRIAGSLNVPLDELERRAGEVPAERIVVVADRVGQESPAAARLLFRLGRAAVLRLDGGVTAWRSQVLPMVAASAR